MILQWWLSYHEDHLCRQLIQQYENALYAKIMIDDYDAHVSIVTVLQYSGGLLQLVAT